MHTGARRFEDPSLRTGTAFASTTGAPPVEHIGDAAPALPVSSGTTVRDDALGGILARAVAQRARDSAAALGVRGATLQRVFGLGKKKKKPARPTQALPAPPRPKQGLPAPARPKQALPPSAAASPSIFIPGAVPQAMIDLAAGKFDVGSEMDPFEVREFNLDTEAPAAAPPPPAMQAEAPGAVAPIDDGYAPDLVTDESGLVPVAGNPYLEWLVSTFASNRNDMAPRSYGALRNLQVLATLRGHPPPRPIDPRLLAPSSDAYDWGFAY